MNAPNLVIEDDRYLDFWRNHPWVSRVELIQGEDGDEGGKIAIWISSDVRQQANGLTEAPLPDRPADLSVFVLGANEQTAFMEATPGAIAVRHFMEAMPDESAPDGWWGTMIWFDDPAARLPEDQPTLH